MTALIPTPQLIISGATVGDAVAQYIAHSNARVAQSITTNAKVGPKPKGEVRHG